MESTRWLFSPLFSSSNWNLEMLVFVEGGKPEYPEKNPRNRDENQQQSQPTYDAETGYRTRVTLVWFFRTTLRDWLTKLAPLSQPMKIKTNRDLLTNVSRAWYQLHAFASNSGVPHCAVCSCKFGSTRTLNLKTPSVIRNTRGSCSI